MTGVYFVFGGSDELIQQVVGLDAEAFSSTDFDVGTRLVLVAQVVTEFGGAARRQRDHFVGEMCVVVGGLVVPESAQRFNDRVLRLGLPGIDHVVDFGDVAEVGM